MTGHKLFLCHGIKINLDVECTSSWIQISLKNYIFCGFIVNSSVLFPNLLELFFSDHWVQLYKIWKAPYEKKTFSKKKFFRPNFKAFIDFFIRLYKENYQKIFFGFLPSFDQNILKMIFGHMSCAKPYSFGQDCPNLFGLGLKWSQWHKLQTNRELFLNLRLDFLFFEKIQFFWKIIKKNI